MEFQRYEEVPTCVLQKQLEIPYVSCFLQVFSGATQTVRPVRLEPPQYFRFTNRDHFSKSPKYALKINPKKCTPLEPHQYFRACVATEYFT